jgi:hypothetical protein
MATRAGRRHVMLLFAVLAGLFLMHGVSAPSMHGMPMSMSAPMSMQVSAPVSSHMDSAMSAPMPATTTVSDAVRTNLEGCETCVPLRPEGMAGLFQALFLIVIMLWRPRLPYAQCLIHPRWPHGPPRTGVQTLRTLSISRT